MNLGSPMSSIVPGVTGVVLAILTRTDQALTGRAVAALAGDNASTGGTNRALRELVRQGVVLELPAGRSKLYSLNREHVAYAPVVALGSLNDELTARIRATLADWNPAPVAVSMFGSTVRGEGNSLSDVDLLIVRHHDVLEDNLPWAMQVADVAGAVLGWSGNTCDVLEYTLEELHQLEQQGDALIEQLRHGAVPLYGQDIEHLLGRFG